MTTAHVKGLNTEFDLNPFIKFIEIKAIELPRFNI